MDSEKREKRNRENEYAGTTRAVLLVRTTYYPTEDVVVLRTWTTREYLLNIFLGEKAGMAGASSEEI